MNKFELSKRINRLPPYLFAEIDKKKQKLKQKGKNFIDLSVGDPDILAPKSVSSVLATKTKIKENQKYALNRGKLSLREQIAKWFQKRFSVKLSPQKQILPLIGSKEGLSHLPLAFVNPGDYVIIPSPSYPGYKGAAIFSGANLYEVPLKEENKFLPELGKIPKKVLKKAKIIYLNYPNNPTTATAPKHFLKDLVKFCRKHNIIIAYDNAYSEIYFNRNEKPLSILEIPGAKSIAIEFHSFSKTFCMTGFRIAWACGNKDLIEGLAKVKSNIDSGIFGSIQDVGEHVLKKESKYVNNLRKQIKQRRDFFLDGLKEKSFPQIYADSTFYIWAKIPKNSGSSFDFAQTLLDRGVVATPGIGFGETGEGFVRFALTVDKTTLAKALKKI